MTGNRRGGKERRGDRIGERAGRREVKERYTHISHRQILDPPLGPSRLYTENFIASFRYFFSISTSVSVSVFQSMRYRFDYFGIGYQPMTNMNFVRYSFR
jgi:hypothetical protein